MDALILGTLYDRLWHTTHPDRFRSIVEIGAILPEPNIPNKERWKTKSGPKFYPFVRKIGGVSLFDFAGFDPETYKERCPLSNWQVFVPYLKSWGSAVWIEIDRLRVEAQFISGTKIVERWNAQGAYKHTIMPYIEAAHLGPLPTTSFLRALFIDDKTQGFRPISLESDKVG